MSTTHPTMRWRCKDCRKCFSVKKGTVMESSKLVLQIWAIVTYMAMTNLKSVSSMKIHRELGIAQKVAWHLIQRVREAFVQNTPPLSCEVDEIYVGEKSKSRPTHKRIDRGTQGKVIAMGAKQRDGKGVARPLGREPGVTLMGFPRETLYVDAYQAYKRRKRPCTCETVKYSDDEYVQGRVHTNASESLWSMFKRCIVGTHHHMSEKYLHRYLKEFASRHNDRGFGALDQMAGVVPRYKPEATPV